MPRYESFHLRYDGGQRAVWGGVAGLVEHFETYASGLPTDAVWRAGGPLLIPGPQNDQHILAWVRGIPMQEIGREGAWQAWGVTGPAGGFGRWMSFWDALAAVPERERLDALAVALSMDARVTAYPPVPQRLAHTLAELHTATDASARRIILNFPSELPLVAWCCLLGPVPPEQATVGAPRRTKLHVKIPFTYDISIANTSLTEVRRADAATSSLFVDVVTAVQCGDLEHALETVGSLRELSAAERRKRIFAPRATGAVPFFPTADNERASPSWQRAELDRSSSFHDEEETAIEPKPKPRLRWHRVFTRVFFGFSVVLMLLLQLIDLAQDGKVQVPDATSSGAAASTDSANTIANDTNGTTSTQGPTAIVEQPPATPPVACNSWWQAPTSRTIVLARVKRKIADNAWTLPGATAPIVASEVWDAASPALARNLAMQLQIKNACDRTIALDGSIGRKTLKAITSCRAASHTILEGDNALQWLCTWSAPQA